MYLTFTQPDTRLKFDEAIRTITPKPDIMRGTEERIVDFYGAKPLPRV
jgi:hypothetical protein